MKMNANLLLFLFAIGSPNEHCDRHLGTFNAPQAYPTGKAPELTFPNYAQTHTLPTSQWISPVTYGHSATAPTDQVYIFLLNSCYSLYICIFFPILFFHIFI